MFFWLHVSGQGDQFCFFFTYSDRANTGINDSIAGFVVALRIPVAKYVGVFVSAPCTLVFLFQHQGAVCTLKGNEEHLARHNG